MVVVLSMCVNKLKTSGGGLGKVVWLICNDVCIKNGGGGGGCQERQIRRKCPTYGGYSNRGWGS